MGFSKSLIIFFNKVIFFKKGASLLFSFVASFFMTISFTEFFNLVTKDADGKAMAIPLICQTFHLFINTMLVSIDFVFGKRVSRIIRKEPFNVDKLTDTVVKYISTGIFTFMLMGLCVGGEIIDSKWIWWGSLVCLNTFWVMSNGFEYSSIGRHFKELRGYKPKIFILFDKVLDLLQLKILNKIDTSFPSIPNEEEVQKEEQPKEQTNES